MTITSGSVGGFRGDDGFASPHNTSGKKIKGKPRSIRERVEALVNYAMKDATFRRTVRGVRESAVIIRALTEFADRNSVKLPYALIRNAAYNVPSHRLWEANTPEDNEDEFDAPEATTDATSDEPPMIQAMRQIVKEKSIKSHKGQMVDLQSANAILTVYDALSAPNKKKLGAMSATAAAKVCWKLVK